MCKFLFDLLLDSSPPRESIFDVVWRTEVPKYVRFFIWQVLFGRVTLLTDLLRGGLHLLGLCCLLCQKAKEYLNHLFRNCRYARACGVFYEKVRH